MQARIDYVVARYREGVGPKRISYEISRDVSEVYRCLHLAREPLRKKVLGRQSVRRLDVSMSWPDYKAFRCKVNGKPVYLGPKGAELLSTLLIRCGRPLKTDDLIACIWPDPDLEPDWAEGSFKGCMRRLREAMPGVIAHASDGYYIKFPHREGERK